MKLHPAGEYHAERPPPDEAPEPATTGRIAILWRAVKRFRADQMTNIAAALAYYSFLAIPAAMLVAVGLFSMFAGANAVGTLVGKLHGILPGQATTLLQGSLTQTTQHRGTGVAVLAIGAVLALWSLTGAMQNVMWGINIAYERKDSRGFVRRRINALLMILFAAIGFALAFGVLVLGPQLSTWFGNALNAKTAVKIGWWVAEWPLLVGGLLVTFAGLMYFGPDEEHRRWRFLSLGSVLAVVVWLAASGAFAFYVSRFGSYNKTWGALSAVVVMLTWLWLSSVALLLGAEINAEAERSRQPRRV